MAKIKEKGAGSINNANSSDDGGTWLCYRCGQVGHLRKDCKVQGPRHAHCTLAQTTAKMHACLINVHWHGGNYGGETTIREEG